MHCVYVCTCVRGMYAHAWAYKGQGRTSRVLWRSLLYHLETSLSQTWSSLCYANSQQISAILLSLHHQHHHYPKLGLLVCKPHRTFHTVMWKPYRSVCLWSTHTPSRISQPINFLFPSLLYQWTLAGNINYLEREGTLFLYLLISLFASEYWWMLQRLQSIGIPSSVFSVPKSDPWAMTAC